MRVSKLFFHPSLGPHKKQRGQTKMRISFERKKDYDAAKGAYVESKTNPYYLSLYVSEKEKVTLNMTDAKELCKFLRKNQIEAQVNAELIQSALDDETEPVPKPAVQAEKSKKQ